jgi:hypothetical protein
MQVAFYKGPGTLFTKAIRFWTKSPYSHAELVLPSGARITSLASQGVVRLAPFKQEELVDWDIVQLPAYTDLRVHDVMAFFESESNCGYDWTGIIFTQVFRNGWEDSDDWFCSEFVAEALKAIDIIPVTVKSASVSPGELHRRLRSLFP